MQQIALKGGRLLVKLKKMTSWLTKLKGGHLRLSKDSNAAISNPNEIIRLSASYTVMASPPESEMRRPPL